MCRGLSVLAGFGAKSPTPQDCGWAGRAVGHHQPPAETPAELGGLHRRNPPPTSNWQWVTPGHHQLKQGPGSALGGQGLGSGP